MPEAQVLHDVMSALMRYQPEIMYWRNNTGAYKKGNHFIKYGQPGSPDIMGCYKGQAFGIECKYNKGKQRDTQVLWQRRWEECGGLYFIVYDKSQIAENVLHKLGIKVI